MIFNMPGYLPDAVTKDVVINNFTTTEEGFVADARALKTLNDSKLSTELLWENASINSAFEAQTLQLDLSEYKYVSIDFHNGSHGRTVKSFPVGYKGFADRTKLYDNGSFYLFQRDVTIATTTIAFETCFSRFTGSDGKVQYGVDSTAFVPARIYGIKGVL